MPHWCQGCLYTKKVHPTFIIIHHQRGLHHSILCFCCHLIYSVKLYKDTFVYYSVHSGYFSPQALRLSQASLKETTTGQIVNLVTSDIQRFEQVNSSIAKISPACVNDFHDFNFILSLC